MKVLECLWNNKNQVVSQQQIFAQVWPHAIFNPSSVQRSIALLRKALEQDSKNPAFIITHPKRGYSLVVEQTVAAVVVPFWKKPWPAFVAVAAVLLLVTGSTWLAGQNHKTNFTQLRPMTSSESSESELVLSPKSDLTAFVRKVAGRDKHIWLKNLASGNEAQITQMAARYHKLGWAKDGSALAYATRTDEHDQIHYQQIDPYTLSAMPAVTLLTLPANSIISYQLQWSATDDLYFVQTAENSQTYLQKLSIKNKQLTTLKRWQGKEQLLTVALSPDETSLALAIYSQQTNHQIALLDLAQLSISTLARLQGQIHGLNWHPDGQSVLVSNREKLLSVGLSKKVTEIAFDNFKYIRNASYRLDGAEIVMELVSLDVDILHSNQAKPYEYQKLVDTQSLDFLPIYAPQEDKFAFESHRNGAKQLFVYQDGQQRLIFTNPNNEELYGFVWSADGQQIITASQDKLFVIDVAAAKFHAVPHEQGPFYLRQWYQHEQALLVSKVTDEGVIPAKFDLVSQQLTRLFNPSGNFKCAFMTLDEQDKLFVSDHQHIYQLSPQGDAELFYSVEYGEITGFTLGQQSFTVGLAKDTEFELVKVSLHEPKQVSLFKTSYHQGLHLTSTSKNADNYLFSQVEDIKELVRLK